MSKYQLIREEYVLPTPAGAYYAVSNNVQDVSRKLLFSLISHQQSQLLTVGLLREWTNTSDDQEALDALFRVQQLGWIQSEAEPREAPHGRLEEMLPRLLATLSSSGKTLLADHQGFYLANYGYAHETAEELSALSADLASLHQRHGGLLSNHLGLNSAAWAIVDASANGQLGFWPLHIGDQRFSLMLSGMPHFNQPSFVELIWALNKRYAVTTQNNEQ